MLNLTPTLFFTSERKCCMLSPKVLFSTAKCSSRWRMKRNQSPIKSPLIRFGMQHASWQATTRQNALLVICIFNLCRLLPFRRNIPRIAPDTGQRRWSSRQSKSRQTAAVRRTTEWRRAAKARNSAKDECRLFEIARHMAPATDFYFFSFGRYFYYKTVILLVFTP